MCYVHAKIQSLHDVDDTTTYLDGHGHCLELERVSPSVVCDSSMCGRAKLIIVFFSMVPFSTGTASSGLSALGRSAGAWFQIYVLSVPLKRSNDPHTYQLCDIPRKSAD